MRKLIIVSLCMLALVFVSVNAFAKSSFLSPWQNLYPASLSAQNVINGTGESCRFCHGESAQKNTKSFNRYGWDMRIEMKDGLEQRGGYKSD